MEMNTLIYCVCTETGEPGRIKIVQYRSGHPLKSGIRKAYMVLAGML